MRAMNDYWYSDENVERIIDEAPDTCPRCGAGKKGVGNGRVVVVYECLTQIAVDDAWHYNCDPNDEVGTK